MTLSRQSVRWLKSRRAFATSSAETTGALLAQDVLSLPTGPWADMHRVTEKG
jgi:hypothetical protein